MTVVLVLATALLSASLTAGALFWLWRTRLMPDLEARAERMAEEATARASAELTRAGEALVPQYRQAMRDGIQDAFLSLPTDRIGQTARGVTTAGVTVVESTLRRLFGGPPRPADHDDLADPWDPDA